MFMSKSKLREETIIYLDNREEIVKELKEREVNMSISEVISNRITIFYFRKICKMMEEIMKEKEGD